MREYDFYEKMYLAELTLRGQILSYIGITVGLTAAAVTGFASQVFTFPFKNIGMIEAITFVIVCIVVAIILAKTIYYMYKAFLPGAYQVLDDPIVYDAYFKELKEYCKKYYQENEEETFRKLSTDHIASRYMTAASHNRTINYMRTYHLNCSHKWLAGSLMGVGMVYVMKTLGA